MLNCGFLLGYAARLNERYQLSVDSYNRGLKQQPNSVRGLAGLAQTYAKWAAIRKQNSCCRKSWKPIQRMQTVCNLRESCCSARIRKRR